MLRTDKLTRAPFFCLAVLGVLIATTPSEDSSGNFDFLIVSKFLALALSAPYFLNSRTITVPLGLVFSTFIVASAFALSNLAMPGDWALAVGVLGPLTMLFGFLMARQQKLLAVIDAVLIINLAALAYQALLYMWTGEIVQLHTLLFPSSDSRSSDYLGFVRLGGLHLEPGTYANFVYVLVVFRLLLGGALTDRLSLLMLLSIAFTFSAWGIFAFLTGIIAVTLSVFSSQRRIGKTLLSVFILTSSLLVVLFSANQLELVLSYLEIRVDINEGSASFRAIAFEELYQTFDRYVLLGMPMAEKFCADCQSPQDLGIWSQIIIRFGAPAAVLIFVTSVISAWKQSASMVILVLYAFTGKYDVSTPVTWLFLALILAAWDRQPKLKSNR